MTLTLELTGPQLADMMNDPLAYIEAVAKTMTQENRPVAAEFLGEAYGRLQTVQAALRAGRLVPEADDAEGVDLAALQREMAAEEILAREG